MKITVSDLIDNTRLQNIAGYLTLDNLKKAVYMVFFLIIIYFLTFHIFIVDYDLWARLAVGSLFYQTGGVLMHDIFSYSPQKPFWIDHEWGTGVLFYSAIKTFGIWGLFVLKALIILTIFILIIKTYKLYIKDKAGISILYFVLIAYSLYPSIASQVRSQIFTFLFFTLWIYLLERVRRGENRLIWFFPLTMILWANLHGGFVTGLGLVAIYAFGEYLNKNKYIKYLVILASSLLATLVNPYGFRFWLYMYEAITLKRIGFIEWQPINILNGPFHSIIGNFKLHILLGFFIFAILILIVAVRLLMKKTKPDWVKILLVSITFIMACRFQRHAILFVLASAGILYHQFYDLIQSWAVFISAKISGKLVQGLSMVKFGMVCAFFLAYSIFVIPNIKYTLIAHPSIYPVGAIEFIKQNNLGGNLAVTYNWGSYALWSLYPQCRVLIDGRYEEVYTADFYNKIALNYSEHLTQYWYLFLKLHTDIILAPKSAYKREELERLKDWRIVYEDFVSYVLLPVNKLRDGYAYPDSRNPIYWSVDLTKKVDLN